MNITSKSSPSKKAQSQNGYPVVKKLLHENYTLLVLFTGDKSGVVLENADKPSEVGQFSNNWIPAYETFYWETFRGTITLEID